LSHGGGGHGGGGHGGGYYHDHNDAGAVAAGMVIGAAVANSNYNACDPNLGYRCDYPD
jgi:hypothetical protein